MRLRRQQSGGGGFQLVRCTRLVQREVGTGRDDGLVHSLTYQCGQGNDRHGLRLGSAAQRLDHGDPVHLGQRDVEDREIESFPRGVVERLLAVASGYDLEPAVLQQLDVP